MSQQISLSTRGSSSTPASGGLVVVHLVSEEARILVPYFLPKTGLRLGRPGEHASYFVYACPVLTETQIVVDPGSNKTLLELTGIRLETLTPTSVHLGNEVLEYESRREPTQVTAEELVECVRELAAATFLSRHWPAEGSRPDTVSALAGMLIGAGWSDYRADRFITRIAFAAGDPEFGKRQSDIESIAKRFSNGEAILGAAALGEVLPGQIVREAVKYLGIKLPETEDEIIQTVADAVTGTERILTTERDFTEAETSS